MNDGQLQAKRAIEALRAGVPNRDAVVALGSAHAGIEQRFRRQLREARERGGEAARPAGFLIAGNFGTGKSHVLEYLQQIALAEHFVVSKVVISKETPLYDPVKLYRSAIRAATVPGRVGAALQQIASELHFDSPAYAAFYQWAQHPNSGLNQRFPASLYLYEYAGSDPDLQHTIISFWSGNPIQVGEIRRGYRELGQRLPFPIDRATIRMLAYQRFRFAPRLMQAAGYAGWVLLFDEVDLIGRYTLFQRARAYAELARWTGNLPNETYPGLTSVVAITAAFAAEILTGKNDLEAVPGRLLSSPSEADRQLSGQAEVGMKLIERVEPALTLTTPDERVIDETYQQVRAIHARAYRWEPPDVGETIERLRSTRMREYVRRWINEWDLRRLDPSYEPATEITPLSYHYGEDAELEAAPEGEAFALDRDE